MLLSGTEVFTAGDLSDLSDLVGTSWLSAVDRDWSLPAGTAAIFQRPTVLVGAPPDFLPRAAMELILHAHDVCAGLGIDFEPPSSLCHRLREHTRRWPMWSLAGNGLPTTDDPWGDLLAGSDRSRLPSS